MDRLLHGRRAIAGSATLSAYVVAERRLVCYTYLLSYF